MKTEELAKLIAPHLDGWGLVHVKADGEALVFTLRRVDPKSEAVFERWLRIEAAQAIQVKGRQVLVEAAMQVQVGQEAETAR